jgi:Cytochrome P460/Putative zinc-finger
MNCNRVRECLPLYVGGDLSSAEADKTIAHLQQCKDCNRFYESLANNQVLLRSLRNEAVSSATLSAMRQELFSRLEVADARLNWWIRLERLFLLGMRRPRFAFASVALVILVSATLLAQLRHVTANSGLTAALEDGGLLSLPSDYKSWTFLGDVTQERGHKKSGVSQKVYMNPVAYREYKRTGTFPEGTVMVLESIQVAGDTGHSSLEASVKDRRFSDGWGYFRFDGSSGQLARKAPALPDSAGCAACHRDRGATDHVFTQFYPVLRPAAGLL